MYAEQLLFVGKKAKHFYSKVEYSEVLKQNRITIFWGGVQFASFWDKDQRPVRNTLAVSFAEAGLSKEDIGRVLGMNPKQVFRCIRRRNSVADGRPGRPAIVDEKIETFVRSDYRRICGHGRRRWRKEVQKQVREKFKREVSLASLSAIVAPLPKRAGKETETKQKESTEKPDTAMAENAEEVSTERSFSEQDTQAVLEQGTSRIGAPEEKQQEATDQYSSPAPEQPSEKNSTVYVSYQPPRDPAELPEAQAGPSPIVVDPPRIELPSQTKLQDRLTEGFSSRYAAALLLNPFIARLLQGVLDRERSVGVGAPLTVEAFMLTFLQMNQFECNNYESISKLHPEEFGVLAGLDCSPSRSTLYRMTPDFLEAMQPMEFAGRIAQNYFQHFGVGSRLFFLDGHFQRYHGQKRMAMGFHPQTRRPQKGYYQYVLSGQDGSPLLLLDSDSLLSFSDSIAYLVARLLPLLPTAQVPWLVFDRGGYQRELQGRFAGAEAKNMQFAAHYIAWEYEDDTDYSNMQLDWQDIVVELKGNDIEHPRLVEFKVAQAPEYVHRGIWANDSPVRHQRRLVLRRDYPTRAGGRIICSPFCTDDWESPAADLVVALTWRWRQENGFKLGDSDYGLDNISSYATETMTPEILKDIPEEFRETIRSRKVPNRAVQQIDKRRRRTQSELGRITERLERVLNAEKVRPDRSNMGLPNDPEILGQLRKERLDQLATLEVEREFLPKQVSRFDRLCDEQTERLDFRKKWKLDILRACAYNIRRLALDTWMSVYSDWRDYTERFRDLLDLGGTIRLQRNVLQVELNTMPQPRYQEAAEGFTKRIQRLHPQTFGIGPYQIRFFFKR